MTPHAPAPLPPYSSATRTRVKWDNIAIVLFGVVIAAFAVVGILASGETKPSTTTAKRTVEPAQAAPPLEDAAPETTLTLEEAQGLVEESRSLMAEARWDEAADRLAMVPEELRETVGVPALEEELAATRATHERLRAELTAAVEARQWKQARVLLTQLDKIAPLDAELLEIQAQVTRALAPTPAPKLEKPAAEADRTDATATGGGATANATKPKPAAQSTRPANTTRPRPATQRPKPATTNPTTPQSAAGALGIQLTAEQQQELEAALAAIDSGEAEGLQSS